MKEYLKKIAADALLEAVKTYSPSGMEYRVRPVFERAARVLGFQDVYVDDAGNVIACYGRGPKTILLAGHIDTVPGELPVTFDGEYITGRGAVDAKGPMIAALAGAALAREDVEGKVKVIVACLVDEERESRGAWHLVESGLKADHCIIAEPSGANGVTIAYRGSAHYKVYSRSSGGHASSGARSALDNIIDFAVKLREISSREGFMATITMIRAGDAPNKLPEYAEAHVDARFTREAEALLARIEEIAAETSCKAVQLSYTPPVEVKPSMPTPRALIRAIVRNGLKPRLVRKRSTSDMNILYRICGGDIASYGPGDPKLSHTDHEKLSINELYTSIEVYAQALRELAALNTNPT